MSLKPTVSPWRVWRKKAFQPTRGNTKKNVPEIAKMAAEITDVTARKAPPTTRREPSTRSTSTRSLEPSPVCLMRRFSSISRRRWSSVKAQVAQIT